MSPPLIEQHHAFLAAIVDSSEDAIISKNLDGIITSWNRAAERIFGYGGAEVIGKHISILIPKDRLPEEEMIISNLKAGRRTEHYETIRQSKDGRLLHISLTVSPIRDTSGRVIGASKIARDISKQKEAEALIKKYILQLETLIDTGKSISADLNIEKIMQKVTEATTRLSGAAFGAFFYNTRDTNDEARTLYSLFGASKKTDKKFGTRKDMAGFDSVFSDREPVRSDDVTGDPWFGENIRCYGMADFDFPVVSYLAVPVISKSGVMIGGLFFGHPEPAVFTAEHERLVEAVSSQAAIALDNANLYQEVKKLNERKDEFISFASHELRTPLTTIKGYLEIAESYPERTQEVAGRIKSQVNRLGTLISDLLDVSKIQTGRLEFRLGSASIATLISESVETVRQVYPGRIFETDIPRGEIKALVDSQKIGQVIVNILSNAAKYSGDDSSILVSASAKEGRVQISVRDGGIGIAPEHLEKIFSQYYRVSSATAGKDGLGLGLYISRRIVEGHHGRIWAESEEGKGSTFIIELPVSS